MTRQTKAALAAVVGLLVGAGTLAGVVLALRDDVESTDSAAPATSETGLVDTGVAEEVEPPPPPPPVLESVDVGGFPNAVAVGFRGVWVVRDGRRLVRIDPRTLDIVARIGAADEIGSQRPCDVATGEDAVWVTTLSGNVARINPASNRISRLIELGESACVAAGARGVWVTQPENGVLVRIDPETTEIVTEIEIGGSPTGVAVGFGSVWVASPAPPDGTSGGITRIDPRTNEVVRTILVPNLPEFVVAGAGGVWATSNNGTIAEIDPRTNQFVSSIRVSEGGRTTVAVGGEAVWAAEIKGVGEESPLFVIDPGTGIPTEVPISTGQTPLGLDFGAGALWIANYDEGTVDRYRPSSEG